MPHLVILYTPNLDLPAAQGGSDMAALCRTLARTLCAQVDEAGKPVVQRGGVPEHRSAPEGARLFVRERRNELERVEWGTTEAWMQAAQVRLVAGGS